jgi:hypothetical protein
MRAKSTTEEDITPRIVCSAPWRLKKVKPLPNYTLEVMFTDGLQGHIEMRTLIMSKKAGVFASLREQTVFNQAHLTHGVLTWPGEIDLAPDAMYDAIQETGRWIL